jgi:hypothetical protein
LILFVQHASLGPEAGGMLFVCAAGRGQCQVTPPSQAARGSRGLRGGPDFMIDVTSGHMGVP